MKQESAMNAATFTSTFGHCMCNVKPILCLLYEMQFLVFPINFSTTNISYNCMFTFQS